MAEVVNRASKVVCDYFAPRRVRVLLLLVWIGETVLFVGELVANGVGVGLSMSVELGTVS